VICEGTWHFSGSFHILIYKWAVLCLPGSRQHCQSFKERNRRECEGSWDLQWRGGSTCWEKSEGEWTISLLQRLTWEKTNKIYWSCNLESSRVGPTWKRLSEGAFELFMKYKKPQQCYFPVARCVHCKLMNRHILEGHGVGRSSNRNLEDTSLMLKTLLYSH